MEWFKHMSVRLKILSLAGLGIFAFLAYFLYSYLVMDANIRHLEAVEHTDFPVLENINRNQVDFISIRESFIAAINEENRAALEEAREQGEQLLERLDSISELDPGIEARVASLSELFTEYMEQATFLARGMIEDTLGQDEFFDGISRVQELQHQFEDAHRAFERERYTSFERHLQTTRNESRNTQLIGVTLGAFALALLALISWRVTRGITSALEYSVDVADTIASGDWDADIHVHSDDETGRLLKAIRHMRDTLKTRRDEDRREERHKTMLAELNERMRGDMTLQELGDSMLSYLVPVLESQAGAFYLFDQDEEVLRLSSSYALEKRKNLANEFAPGESLVGQCALEKKQILLTRVPDDYLSIGSATGEGTPRNVVVTPIVHENELKGVLELAAFREFNEDDQRILDEGTRSIAVAVHTSQSRSRLAEMLEKSEEQSRELEKQKQEMARVNEDLENQAMELAASESKLQEQQEELRSTNEELESQAQQLRASEESLQAQQEELRVTNEELEAQAKILSEQKAEMAEKNKQLELYRDELQTKIEELELSSKYKSEFLSTMSHELRTPLNSILILSNALADNKKGNLTDKQVEHASVIHSAGSDLLSLINDILDISKIEEGKMDVVYDELEPAELADHFQRHFAHIAENKGVEFHTRLGDNLPDRLYTDRQRLEQIIKNLLSNSLKFTEEGSVTLSIEQPGKDEKLPSRELVPEKTLRLSVIDTGIGIPQEKQMQIFEAFQQADGTTSRKYGGTGLGLTISRELARMLGGDITLYSEGEGLGTTFSLYLPAGDASLLEEGEEQDDASGEAPVIASAAPEPVSSAASAAGQHAGEAPSEEAWHVREKTVLIIEDDADFAKVLVELASDYGLEAHVCPDGETGLEYARHHRPSAIILDIGLPGMDGWEVMERLKAEARTKDIPVHFLSGKDERKKALEAGAIDFLSKPIKKEDVEEAFANIERATESNVRRLLVVEDSEIQHESIRELFDSGGVNITPATDGATALKLLREEVFDCMILDLTLPDMSGIELLETIHEDDQYDNVPVIIYTGKDLSRDEESKLRKYADRIILKTDRSSERLLNEASLFLHWLESSLPSGQKEPSTTAIEHRDDVFEGKRLLLVDDDMRNIYALSAQLEDLGFSIEIANNGIEALEALDNNPDVDLVLMDIMMPEMDGYEAMRRIREQERFARLPILALTAKAMKDDRAQCIEAGANDYCSKPIEMGKLTSLMRVWLPR